MLVILYEVFIVVLFYLLKLYFVGHIVTTSYKQPKGGWFDLVTCPHYLAEVVIYISILFVLGFRHITWWMCVIYILIHHIFLAHSTKSFYMAKFSDYPEDRKMIIPYIL